MKTALIQMCSSDDPAANLAQAQGFIREAVAGGAGFVLTPEVTNCVSSSRSHQMAVLQHQDDDICLSGLRETAAAHGIWLLIGSLALKTNGAEAPFVNRSFLIDPKGQIAAQYDKIHMFDVDIEGEASFRESAAFMPGDQAVLAKTPFAHLGLTICYDLRFAHLHRHLAQMGANVITAPAAFSPTTGAAHWEVLLRARAIETGAYVLAPAQCGTHNADKGKPRRTYGHSIAIAPWGEILCQAGTDPCVIFTEIDLKKVDKARRQVPSLRHDRPFKEAKI